MKSPAMDLVGRRFGRLVVLAFMLGKWLCRCDCGKEKSIAQRSLLVGATLSCGCLHRERTSESNRKHLACDTITYKRWKSMRDRCNNPQSKSYSLYGGRGIAICEHWHEFDRFLADMGECPGQPYTLERNDSNGNYEPSNCRWATKKEQSRNTSRNKFLTYQGQTLCVGEWAELLGLSYTTINSRLRRGKSVEQALSTELCPPAFRCRHGALSRKECALCSQEIEETDQSALRLTGPTC